MIRPATHSDIPAMLEMAERFILKAWARVEVPYHEESCTTLLANLIDGERGICLIADDRRAMLGAVIHPWHFNTTILTATELFWWAEPGNHDGAALRHECERIVAASGATTMNMACEAHMRSGALDRLYRMNGYTPSEHIFIKRLV